MLSSGGSHKAENLRKRPHCVPDIAASQSSQKAQLDAHIGHGGRIRVESGRSWLFMGLRTFSGYSDNSVSNGGVFLDRLWHVSRQNC